MNKFDYKGFVFNLVKVAKDFVTSKDLFIFLFFLVLTAVMWSLQSLSKTNKFTISLPIVYDDLPKGFCQSENLCDTLEADIECRGWTLLPYYFKSLAGANDPVVVKTKNYTQGSNIVSTKKFSDDIKAMFSGDVRVSNLRPDILDIKLSKIVSKRVPVALNAVIRPFSQYVHIGTEISPEYVVIEGAEEELDKIDTVFTVKSDDKFSDIKEVFRDSIELNVGRYAFCQQKKVEVIVRVEQYTEKIIETVAITSVGVPPHHKLRVFPSTAKVICKTALSNWKDVAPSQFTLAVDYQDALTKTDKLKISVLKQPTTVFDIRVMPETVEYIIDDFGGQ